MAAAEMAAKGGAISIRPARSGDVAALAELSTQLGYPASAETLLERLTKVRERGVGEVFVAADAHDEVLGWTHVVPRLHLEDPPFAELAGLVVSDRARGAGVGATLLKAAEQWARQQGFVHFRVRSNVVRERAHRFYKREGYVERKRQVVLEKDLV